MRVGIVYGGKSSEHSVSLTSAEHIMSSLESTGFEVVRIFVSSQGEWVWIKDVDLGFEDQPKLCGVPGRGLCLVNQPNVCLELDVIFDIVHGNGGEDGCYQGFFRLLELPFVGSDVVGSVLCMDKVVSKRVLGSIGINCPEFLSGTPQELLDLGADKVFATLGNRVFVKPVNTGSSVGISRVTDHQSYISAVKEAARFDLRVVVEKEVCGREIEIAVWQESLDGPVYTSSAAEIVAESDFYSYKTKYINTGDAKLVVPAELDDQTLVQLQSMARKAFTALEVRGFARVDFFVAPGKIYLNEVNTLPGFTSISMFPRLVEHSGFSLGNVLSSCIREALQRGSKRLRLGDTCVVPESEKKNSSFVSKNVNRETI